MPQLTFTRFIAAFLIVIFHFGLTVWPFNQPIFNNWLKLAPVGVSYFFLLSGFILTFVYNRKEEINRKQYFLARLARIYPLYFLALLSLIFFLLLTKQKIDLTALFLQIFLIQAWLPKYSATLNIPSWSLSVELLFYIIFPFLVVGLKKIKNSSSLIVFSLLFWLFSFSIYYYGMKQFSVTNSDLLHHFLNYNPLLHLNSFIIGIASCLLVTRFKKELSIKTSLLLIFLPIIIIAFLVLSYNPVLHYYNNGLLTPFFAMLLIGLANNKTLIAKLFLWRPFVFLGDISYGIYILQVPVNYWWGAFYDHYFFGYPGLKFWGFIFLLLLISWALFELVENPIRKWVKNLVISS